MKKQKMQIRYEVSFNDPLRVDRAFELILKKLPSEYFEPTKVLVEMEKRSDGKND